MEGEKVEFCEENGSPLENNLGDWVVWNGNEKKGFVCQYKKKGIILGKLFNFSPVLI